MNKTIEQIQRAILDPNIPLSSILLKAKVLAYELENDELKKWIRNEMDGYLNKDNVPDYRMRSIQPIGNFTGQLHTGTNIGIPLSALPDWLRKRGGIFHVYDGIRSIEEIAQSGTVSHINWPAEWIGTVNKAGLLTDPSASWTQVKWLVPAYIFAQILETVRSRLQDFVLEISTLSWDIGNETPPSETIQHIFNITILNTPHGGTMSIFDQRGQNVNSQYNAAGDINFNTVQNKTDLVRELEKLKTELTKAGMEQIIDAETVTNAEYQITQAIQQAQKPTADKKTILDHLETAKATIESVTAAGSMVTALAQAADQVSKLF